MNHGWCLRGGTSRYTGRTYILAMKLRAARPKDEGDVLWLMEQTGIKDKGALIHLAEWIYPSEPVTRYMEWFIEQAVRKFRE